MPIIFFPQMAVQPKLTMRVVSEGDIRKMTMTTRPDTLEDLIGWLKGALQETTSPYNTKILNLTTRCATLQVSLNSQRSQPTKSFQ